VTSNALQQLVIVVAVTVVVMLLGHLDDDRRLLRLKAIIRLPAGFGGPRPGTTISQIPLRTPSPHEIEPGSSAVHIMVWAV
jgi:hypothetical protein